MRLRRHSGSEDGDMDTEDIEEKFSEIDEFIDSIDRRVSRLETEVELFQKGEKGE